MENKYAFDRELGSRIRKRRIACGMSSQKLGSSLESPVSYQQINKYEHGTDSVPLWRLKQIAHTLDTSLAAFAAQTDLINDPDIKDIFAIIGLLPPEVRNRLLRLMECLIGRSPDSGI